MQIQFDNKLISSFMLYLDRALLVSGSAFSNSSGRLYRATGNINGLNIYSTPFKQLVYDTSVTGASIMSGVYVNGVFSMPGQNGLHSINIDEGQSYFTTTPTGVSGVYAVKDFSFYLTDKPEEEILFEAKYSLRGEVPQTPTGLWQDAQTFPVIYIKSLRGENTPFCLGGIDNNENTYRAIILGDSQFITDAVCSIFKNLARKKFKVIEPATMPFNAYGGLTGVNFNYTGLAAAATQESLIWKARVSSLLNSRQLNQINPGVFPAFVDFETWSILAP
jgi:hypothetical protein